MSRHLSTADVARILRVSPKTVCPWAAEGSIEAAHLTLGGHRRFDPEYIEGVRRQLTTSAARAAQHNKSRRRASTKKR